MTGRVSAVRLRRFRERLNGCGILFLQFLGAFGLLLAHPAYRFFQRWQVASLIPSFRATSGMVEPVASSPSARRSLCARSVLVNSPCP